MGKMGIRQVRQGDVSFVLLIYKINVLKEELMKGKIKP
jgi:hypothetical protein